MGDAPILKVEDVAKRFATPEGPLVAIENISFEVGAAGGADQDSAEVAGAA